MSEPPQYPPPPPYQPGPPFQPYPPASPSPQRRNRPLLIIGIVAAVLVLACTCCAAGTFFFSDQVRDLASDMGIGEDDPPGPAPSAATVAPSSLPPLDCRVSSVPPTAGTKAVGLPDFAAARRDGSATMTMTTNLGTVTVLMDRAKTPCTVASFAHLADRRFFDSTSCHRLVTSGLFVLQCGDPSATGTGGPDYRFADENLAGARYNRGVVAMANAGPDTNGSQFFIVYGDSDLPAAYTPFGQVTGGLDVIDRVAAGGVESAGLPGEGRPVVGLSFQTVTVT